MELAIGVEADLPCAPEAVWRTLVDLEALPRVLRPVFPIPGVARATVEGGGPLAVGSTRLVSLTDRTTGRERILALDAPTHHAYELTGLAPPFGWLVARGLADWRLRPSGAGTQVRWEYRFQLTSAWAWPAARLALVPFRRFMRAGLRGLEQAALG